MTQLARLEALDLRYVNLSDVDLQILDIPSLRKLNVDSQPLKEKIAQLRKKIPQLDPETSTRISIEADFTNETRMYAYDFYSNRMELEW